MLNLQPGTHSEAFEPDWPPVAQVCAGAMLTCRSTPVAVMSLQARPHFPKKQSRSRPVMLTRAAMLTSGRLKAAACSQVLQQQPAADVRAPARPFEVPGSCHAENQKRPAAQALCAPRGRDYTTYARAALTQGAARSVQWLRCGSDAADRVSGAVDRHNSIHIT
jgi:hypothetical protein